LPDDAGMARLDSPPSIAGHKPIGRSEVFEPAPAKLFARRPYYPWLVVGTVCIGTFIGQVDGSIVQLALPSLENAFGAPLDAVSWVALGYMLAFASVLPVFARMAEIAGRKTLYLAGFALFGLWSALCGLATSLPVLIGFRVLQGMSGALLGANSVVILVAAAGPARRGQALGIMSAAQAVGLSIGPALGGVLLGTLGWRWIFWVTVPFAILGTLLGWLIVPRTTTFAGDRRFDLPGAILLVPALATLLLAISGPGASQPRSSHAPSPRRFCSAASSGARPVRRRRSSTSVSSGPPPSRPEALACSSPMECSTGCSSRCRSRSSAATTISRWPPACGSPSSRSRSGSSRRLAARSRTSARAC